MQDFIEVIAGKRFHIKKKIGQGAFSSIYLGKDITNDEEVCLKIESNSQADKFLVHEAKVYRILEGGTGIPRILWSGAEGEFKVLVIDILGPSLEDLFVYCGRRFSLKTVLMVADQVLARVEYLHGKHFLHRDINPENFLVGLGEKADKIYMVDFGTALKYQHGEEHIPIGRTAFGLGSNKFKSVHAHMGVEQGRRDDLESVGYMLLYFLLGELPWEEVFSFEKEDRNLNFKERKVEIPVELLCHGVPEEFSQYMNYVLSLEFEEVPDYKWIRRLFRGLADKEGLEWDFIFDWAKKTGDVSTIGLPRPARKRDTALSDESTWSHIVKR